MSSAWLPRGLRRLRTLSGKHPARPHHLARAGAGAAAFADTVRARHASRAAAPPGPELAMRRRQTDGTIWVQHVHPQPAAPQIALSLHLQPILRVRADTAPMAAWHPEIRAASATPPPVSAHTRMIERVVARERRVHSVVTARDLIREAGAPPPAVRAEVSTQLPRVQPVEMAARRAPQAAAAPSAAGTAAAAHEPPTPTPLRARLASDTPVRAAAAPGAIPLSPGEIGRLTDQVVRAIDRRALAARERQGCV